MRLILLAVSDPAELHGIPGVPDVLPDWVKVKGVVQPAEALLYTRAADAVIAEGTSTMHEGAALRTPLVLVPGPIPEATLLAQRLGEQGAGRLLTPKDATPGGFAQVFTAALTHGAARDAALERAHALVTGGGGAAAAAKVVLNVAARFAAGTVWSAADCAL